MKKLLILIFIPVMLLLGSSQQVQAQKYVAKLRPVAFFIQTLPAFESSSFFGDIKIKRNITEYALGAAFEAALTEKLSIQGNIDYVTGVNDPFIHIRPEVRFYLLDDALYGLYTGGFVNVGFGVEGIGVHMAIGPVIGYQFIFGEVFVLDINYPIGFGFFGNGAVDGEGIGGGLYALPSICIGFAFGG